MLAQLQSMIDTVKVQAGPVLRDVAVKAAELAAVAGDRAGPLAYKAAEKTQMVGQMLAEKSKGVAADLRRQQNEGETEEMAPPHNEAADAAASEMATADAGWPASDKPAGDSLDS
jgi:hypothetical protein